MKTQDVKVNDVLQYTKYIKGDKTTDKVVYEGTITNINNDSFRFVVSKATEYKNKTVTFTFTDKVAGTILRVPKSANLKKIN